MIDNRIIREIVFDVTDFTGLVSNRWEWTAAPRVYPSGDLKFASRDSILYDITIKNIEHCSQSRGIEEQFIIVNFDIIWKHNNHDSKKTYTINR